MRHSAGYSSFHNRRGREGQDVSSKRDPVGLKDKLKVKLENLVNNGVIQYVDQPTDWLSQMTITLKKNNMTSEYI